jgi:hypothetical protein
LVVGSDTERDVTRAFDITLAPPTVGVTRLAGCSAEVMRSYLASADPSDSRR